jgi:hypothetical protein
MFEVEGKTLSAEESVQAQVKAGDPVVVGVKGREGDPEVAHDAGVKLNELNKEGHPSIKEVKVEAEAPQLGHRERRTRQDISVRLNREGKNHGIQAFCPDADGHLAERALRLEIAELAEKKAEAVFQAIEARLGDGGLDELRDEHGLTVDLGGTMRDIALKTWHSGDAYSLERDRTINRVGVAVQSHQIAIDADDGTIFYDEETTQNGAAYKRYVQWVYDNAPAYMQGANRWKIMDTAQMNFGEYCKHFDIETPPVHTVTCVQSIFDEGNLGGGVDRNRTGSFDTLMLPEETFRYTDGGDESEINRDIFAGGNVDVSQLRGITFEGGRIHSIDKNQARAWETEFFVKLTEELMRRMNGALSLNMRYEPKDEKRTKARFEGVNEMDTAQLLARHVKFDFMRAETEGNDYGVGQLVIRLPEDEEVTVQADLKEEEEGGE